MRRHCLSLLGLLFVAFCAAAQPRPAPYYPDAAWQRRGAPEAGIDAPPPKDADHLSPAPESPNPPGLTPDPYHAIRRQPPAPAILPLKERGAPTAVMPPP